MSLDDIFKIIDEFDDQTFETYKKNLYGTFGFRVIKIEDVRRIDVKEKLADFFARNDIARCAQGNYAKAFAELVKEDVIEHFQSTDNKRNYQYLQQELTYLDYVKHGHENSMALLENFIVIYISQYRTFFNAGIKRKADLRSNIVYYISKDDINTAKLICRQNWDRREVPLPPTKQRRGQPVQQGKTTIYFSQAEKDYMYMIIMLIVFRILQYEGGI